MVFIPHSHIVAGLTLPWMENYILLGPQLEASQDRHLCLGEWIVPFMSSLQVCPCIINDFHKTINSISVEVTRENKNRVQIHWTGLIAHLDVPKAQSVQHSEVEISPHSNKESVHLCHQAPGRGHAENWTSHVDDTEQQSTPTHMAALILSFNKSNTLPRFLAAAK